MWIYLDLEDESDASIECSLGSEFFHFRHVSLSLFLIQNHTSYRASASMTLQKACYLPLIHCFSDAYVPCRKSTLDYNL